MSAGPTSTPQREEQLRQTVAPGPDGYRLLDDQKSNASAPTVHLDSRTVARLREQRADQDRARQEAGTAWKDHGLVFSRADGSWWNPPAISLAFGRAVRSAGVPRIRLHDLRHTQRHPAPGGRAQPEGCLGAARPQLGGLHARHLRPCHAGMQPEAAELFVRLVFGRPTENVRDDEESDDDRHP